MKYKIKESITTGMLDEAGISRDISGMDCDIIMYWNKTDSVTVEVIIPDEVIKTLNPGTGYTNPKHKEGWDIPTTWIQSIKE